MKGDAYDADKFLHREVTEKCIGVFYDVCNELGYGFLESVYQAAMVVALRQGGLHVDFEIEIPVYFRNLRIGMFAADILVENKVLLELKSASSLVSAHEKQILNYLRATEIEVGLLMNFGPKAEVKRFAYSNSRKVLRPEIPPRPADSR